MSAHKEIIQSVKEQFLSISKGNGNIVNYATEANFAMQIINNSPQLQGCHPESIKAAVTNVAACGLSLNPALGLAYLVPRGGMCCLDISYRGLVKLATEYGNLEMVSAEIVREKDSFIYKGPFSAPIHEFDLFCDKNNRGNIRGVYCIAKMKNGNLLVGGMGYEEIKKIKALSKASKGPWIDFEEQMAKKAIIKRESKLWPKCEILNQAISVLNAHEGIELEAEEQYEIKQVKSISPTQAAQEPNIEETKTTQEEPKKIEVKTDNKTISASQAKIIRIKADQAGVAIGDLVIQFSVDSFEQLPMSKINEILKFISDKKNA